MNCQRGFSLIELLVVVALIVLIMGMALAIPRGDKRAAAVMEAARELAQTLRQARALAIEDQAPVAVTFNLQNAPGTDGSVLNNWTGGHWYQVVRSFEMVGGSDSGKYNGYHGLPQGGLARRFNKFLTDVRGNTDTPATAAVDRIRSCFSGERVVLSPHQVRFLALSDQDNGGAQYYINGANNTTFMDPTRLGTAYGRTYPRPWFGTWDPSANRLYGWGGYTPEVTLQKLMYYATDRQPSGTPLSPSAFWYEGHDGPISNSLHPRDRFIGSDIQGDDGVFQTVTGNAYCPQDAPVSCSTRFFAKGEPRPVINGEWMDVTIEFFPDGRVRMGTFEGLRLAYANSATWGSPFGWLPDLAHATRPSGLPVTAPQPWDLTCIGPGDMCAVDMCHLWTAGMNSTGVGDTTFGPWNRGRDTCDATLWAASSSSYVDRSGWMWITLGPDAEQTINHFDSAQAALQSLMPAVRVGVSRFGEVRVVRISNTMPAETAARYQLDTELAGTQWDNNVFMAPRYRGNVRTTITGAPLGIPAQDFLTKQMLELRTWWLVAK